jgi:hypothetical protein
MAGELSTGLTGREPALEQIVPEECEFNVKRVGILCGEKGLSTAHVKSIKRGAASATPLPLLNFNI